MTHDISVQHQLEIAQREVEYLQEKITSVITSIQDAMKESYYEHDEEKIFSYSICLFFGVPYKKYCNLPKKLKITASREFQTREYQNHYEVLKGYGGKFGFNLEYDNKGFICFTSNLIHALKYDLQQIWWFYLNQHKGYCEGLKQFIDDCNSSKLNLYDIYQDYLRYTKKEYIFSKINFPDLKINDVIFMLKE